VFNEYKTKEGLKTTVAHSFAYRFSPIKTRTTLQPKMVVDKTRQEKRIDNAYLNYSLQLRLEVREGT